MADWTVSADDLAAVRRMVGEPDDVAPWTDDVLTGIIAGYPLRDSSNHEPGDDAWVPTFDLNAAAAEVWEQKAAALTSQYDATVDGTTARRSQKFTHALRMAQYYRARRSARVTAVTTVGDAATVTPEEVGASDDADA
ncbi:MAG TPA: hypothetical protein ENJ54_01155 [Chloroflexi bacterium]|nr:hypothetical protein [Chloroflexota bacterium]